MGRAISPKLVVRPAAPGSGKAILGPVGSALLISAIRIASITLAIVDLTGIGGKCYLQNWLLRSYLKVILAMPISDQIRYFDTCACLVETPVQCALLGDIS